MWSNTVWGILTMIFSRLIMIALGLILFIFTLFQILWGAYIVNLSLSKIGKTLLITSSYFFLLFVFLFSSETPTLLWHCTTSTWGPLYFISTFFPLLFKLNIFLLTYHQGNCIIWLSSSYSYLISCINFYNFRYCIF